MKFKTRRPGCRKRAKHWWHDWFAWHPVRLSPTKVVWLETVKRKGHKWDDWYDSCWNWYYKEK